QASEKIRPRPRPEARGPRPFPKARGPGLLQRRPVAPLRRLMRSSAVTAISPSLRAFAEEPALTLGVAPPPTRRLVSPRYALELSPVPAQSLTCCVRTTEAELDATIADVRREVRGYGYTANVWQVGPSCG